MSQTCKQIIRTQFNNCRNTVYKVLWKHNRGGDSPQKKVRDGETMVQEIAEKKWNLN